MSNLTASHKELNMTDQTPLPLRNDTILGVCEAIGQDFGFDPLWLRLVFVASIFFAPMVGLGAYLGLGGIVAATRYFAPNPPASEQVADAQAVEDEDEQLPIAA